MAILIEVVSPILSVVELEGPVRNVTVVRSSPPPLETTGSQAVLEVVGANVVNNAIVSPTEPPNPYEGMVWIQVPA